MGVCCVYNDNSALHNSREQVESGAVDPLGDPQENGGATYVFHAMMEVRRRQQNEADLRRGDGDDEKMVESSGIGKMLDMESYREAQTCLEGLSGLLQRAVTHLVDVPFPAKCLMQLPVVALFHPGEAVSRLTRQMTADNAAPVQLDLADPDTMPKLNFYAQELAVIEKMLREVMSQLTVAMDGTGLGPVMEQFRLVDLGERSESVETRFAEWASYTAARQVERQRARAESFVGLSQEVHPPLSQLEGTADED